jgi:hypothetical protein
MASDLLTSPFDAFFAIVDFQLAGWDLP